MTPIEQRVWQSLVTLTSRLPAEIDSHLHRSDGLTHFEYRVLSTLSQTPGHRVRLVVLAEQTHGSLSRLSHVLNKLERAGWVRRERPAFGRGVRAVLTEAGHAVVAEATPGYQKLVQTLVFDGLDDHQLPPLARLLEVLVAHTEASGGAA
ncbi:MarR family transcriptional regulator [Nocardia sp. NPDC050712]|uniref:MarR family winged helix-turn-helix transcriptional regulator n=1 Tax=Nocardia sp. NPDC050712 TaxID=3155518 RepID=UPI0033F16056